MTEPHGRTISIYSFVDYNLKGNIMTRRSYNGIIVYIQKAPIIWFNKRKNKAKVDTFGSKLVALSIYKDLIVALRYKLQMFGVRLEGPAFFSVTIVEL